MYRGASGTQLGSRRLFLLRRAKTKEAWHERRGERRLRRAICVGRNTRDDDGSVAILLAEEAPETRASVREGWPMCPHPPRECASVFGRARAPCGAPMKSPNRLKSWIVDVFSEVESRPLWQVVVAKVVHKLWPGFREA